MWCFCSSPDLYTGTKELSYPACRRLGPDTQAQGRVVKLTLTAEVRHVPNPGQPTSDKPEYGEPDAVIARSHRRALKGVAESAETPPIAVLPRFPQRHRQLCLTSGKCG